MHKFKKMIILAGATLLLVATSATAFALATNNPAEIVANLTGRTTAEVILERQQTGKSFGTIANEAGKLAEFQQARLNAQQEALANQVKAGNLTQAQADAKVNQIVANQTTCNGTGLNQGNCNGTGLNQGVCNGTGLNQGQGGKNGGHHRGGRQGNGNGNGQGNGAYAGHHNNGNHIQGCNLANCDGSCIYQ